MSFTVPLSHYDQLKSGFFMSLQESVFGKEYSNFLDASKKLDAAIHRVEAEGNEMTAAATNPACEPPCSG